MDDRLSSSSHLQNNNILPAAEKPKFVELILDVFLYYALCKYSDVKSKALTGLGFICSSYPEIMLSDRVKGLYFDALQSHCVQVSYATKSALAFLQSRPSFFPKMIITQKAEFSSKLNSKLDQKTSF